jgi:hypothetical protein
MTSLDALLARLEEAAIEEKTEDLTLDVAQPKWTDADLARAYLEGRDDGICGILSASEANLAYQVAKQKYKISLSE